MADNSAKIYAQSQKEIQKLVNAANTEQLKYNKEEAATARQWQTNMSNTAHTREVADLKKAGLNPVLSANSGAQSYTTSAAQAQLESGASALSNLAGSKMSADATQKAAAQSAAATRWAAQQAAASQRYAAAMAYQASVYHSDRAYEASKYKSDMDYKTAMKKPQGNPIAVLDKYLGSELTKTQQQKVLQQAKKLDANSFVVNRDKNNFNLNKSGVAIVKRGLLAAGIKDASKSNQNLFVKAFYYNDGSAAKRLKAIARAENQLAIKQAKSAATVYAKNKQSWDFPRWR